MFKPSLEVWPIIDKKVNNLRFFRNIIIDIYPFQKIKSNNCLTIPAYSIEYCPFCKIEQKGIVTNKVQVVDPTFTLSSPFVQCPYCNNSFKPKNYIQCESQTKLTGDKFNIFKVWDEKMSESSFHKYIVILAFDLCCGNSAFKTVKSDYFAALDALPPNFKFLPCFIRENSIVFFERSNELLIPKEFSFSFSPSSSDFFFSLLCNKQDEIQHIKSYVNSIAPMNIGGKDLLGVRGILSFVNACPDLYARVIWFSPHDPKFGTGSIDSIPELKKTFLDWISPTSIDNPQKVNGFYIDSKLSQLDCNYHTSQVINLFSRISKSIPIYDVCISASVTNAEFLNGTNIHYVSCADEFFSHQFLLRCDEKMPSKLSINVSYTSFEDEVPHKESIFFSKIFHKSNDFISVASTLDPYVMIPYLNSQNLVSDKTIASPSVQFISQLYMQYNEVYSEMPGKESFNKNILNFSAMPNLQPLLQSETYPKIQRKYYRDIPFKDTYKSRYYAILPNISFWIDFDSMISNHCHPFEQFYSLLGRPPIVVLDTVSIISIFTSFMIDSIITEEVEYEIDEQNKIHIIQTKEIESIDQGFISSDEELKDENYVNQTLDGQILDEKNIIQFNEIPNDSLTEEQIRNGIHKALQKRRRFDKINDYSLIPVSSNLHKFLDKKISKRFPSPYIRLYPLEKYSEDIIIGPGKAKENAKELKKIIDKSLSSLT